MADYKKSTRLSLSKRVGSGRSRTQTLSKRRKQYGGGCDTSNVRCRPFKSYFRNLRRFRRGNSFLMKFPANEEATGSNYTQCYVKAMLQNAIEPSLNGRVGGVKKEWVTQHSDVLICDWFLQNPQRFVFKHCLLIRKYRNGRRTKDGRRIERVNWLQRLTKIITTKNRSF